MLKIKRATLNKIKKTFLFLIIVGFAIFLYRDNFVSNVVDEEKNQVVEKDKTSKDKAKKESSKKSDKKVVKKKTSKNNSSSTNSSVSNSNSNSSSSSNTTKKSQSTTKPKTPTKPKQKTKPNQPTYNLPEGYTLMSCSDAYAKSKQLLAQGKASSVFEVNNGMCGFKVE